MHRDREIKCDLESLGCGVTNTSRHSLLPWHVYFVTTSKYSLARSACHTALKTRSCNYLIRGYLISGSGAYVRK